MMRTKRLVRGFGRALHILWGDLRAFNIPAVLFLLGWGCVLLLSTWGAVSVSRLMALCTVSAYLAVRRCRGWGQTLWSVGFPFFTVVVTVAFIIIEFFIYPDFSPNGRENYTRVRRDFFPKEIPESAYDVQVWSKIAFGPGEDEAYLSYRDAKENIRPYDTMARERAEMRTRSSRINNVIGVPEIRVDEAAAVPRFKALPLWQRLFIDYVPHPAKLGVLKEKFVFYVWDIGDDPSRPRANIIGISEDGTHIIFYWVGG